MGVKQCYGRRTRDLEFGPVQMNNFRGLFGIRRMDRVLHIWIRELCRVTKRINKRVDEDVLW